MSIARTGGNVGINTTAPAEQLHVEGNLRIGTTSPSINSNTDHLRMMYGVRANDTSYEWFGFYSGTTRQGIILYDGSWSGANSSTDEFSITAENGNKLTLNTNGDHISLNPDGTGDVGIRTLTPLSDLDIRQTGGSAGAQQTGGINLANGVYHWRMYNSSNFVRWNYSSNSGATYTAMAYINPTNGSWNQLSDASMKNSIKPLENVIDKVMRLKPVDYKYNHNTEKDPRSTGFLAQEVQEIFPAFVSHEEGEPLLGIDYSQFGVIAIKAIQEQQAEINELKALVMQLLEN